MFKRLSLLAMGLLVVALAACVPSGGVTEDALDATSIIPPAGTSENEANPTSAVPPVGTPPEEPTAPAEATAEMPSGESGTLPSGEVPPTLFDAAVADALARSGAMQSSVTVQTAEQVEWSDGSLGCPAPDMMYTQAIVPGYHVVLDVGGQTYDYRLSERGLMLLCQNGLPVSVGG
jgi:hypothetical protein